MALSAADSGAKSLASLKRFVRKPRPETEEHCELCAAQLATMHSHLLEVKERRVVCACEPCAILFSGHAAQRYRRIPRDVERLQNFVLDDQEWNSLLIPINLAFFVRSSSAGREVAQYPSPGGIMESSLDLEYWSMIVEHNPILAKLEPDVEALLVNRVSDSFQYYRAPIDHCFRLVGIIRTHWRGLSGGSEVWTEIAKFFEQLDQLAGGAIA